MIRMMTAIVLALGLVASAAAQETTRTSGARAAGSSAAAAAVINLNTASAAQLETLPGVGKATAERILEYRQKNGGFKKVEDLMNVRGIGEKSFLKIKDRLSVAEVKK
jgi:competence protein ComEA